jgi:sialic acid synthase SpsE
MRFIAEAGICHNGSLERAIEMIYAAKDAGADTIKFQMIDPEHFAEDLVWKGWHMRKLFADCAFTMKEWETIKKECEANGIRFLCTPQTVGDFEKLEKLDVIEIKISSDNLKNKALIQAIFNSRKFYDGFYSTGMATRDEILMVAENISTKYWTPMFCTSEYPCPPESVNFNRWWEWKNISNAVTPIDYGFSDHTIGSMAAVMALALGARVFEKHFTMDNNLPGPDHSWACNPVALERYFDDLRTAETMLGTGDFKPTEAELELKKLLGV